MSESEDIFDGIDGSAPREALEVDYDPDDVCTLSTAVVMAVATAKATDPRRIEGLSTAIDPDALDELFAGPMGSGREDGEVYFTLDGCEVMVRGTGRIRVYNPDA